MADNIAFRDAEPSEDDEVARVMYNAFLPIWNHNWFQCLDAPLEPIRSTSSPLSPLQARRLAFYRSWIALNRHHHGDVTVAYTPAATGATAPRRSSSSSSAASPHSHQIAAVCLLLPPHARPSWSEGRVAWRTGLTQALLGLSLRGLGRVAFTFEGNVGRMIAQALKRMDVADGREERLVQVQGCVRNPEWEGRAPARRLLDWAIRRRWELQRAEGGGQGRPIPVWLDTTIDEGVRAYEAVGFRLVGECMVNTGADKKGIKLKKDATMEQREEGRQIAKQRVMIRLPEA